MKAICGFKCISGLSFQQKTTTTQMQQDCSVRASTRHYPSNTLQARGLQTPSDVIPAFAQHSSSKDDRLRRPKYPERRNTGLRPAFPEQRMASIYTACKPPTRATQSRPSAGIPRATLTPSDAIPALGRHSPCNAIAPVTAAPAPAPHYKFGKTKHCRVEVQDCYATTSTRHSPSNASIAGLRPAYPETRDADLRPEFSEQRN
jgi:hypothetical protein